MPRFVVLLHETPPGYDRPTHWDLMLERDGALRTWALKREPCDEKWIDAEALPDHRLAYLDYQGPVSQDRGAVTRWDEGVYTVLAEDAARLEVMLHGGRLQGRAVLEQAAGGEEHYRWRFSLSP
jgi:hypothetical protein